MLLQYDSPEEQHPYKDHKHVASGKKKKKSQTSPDKGKVTNFLSDFFWYEN